MQASIEKYVNHCTICQKFNAPLKSMGNYQLKSLSPWVEVHVDHIGPYTQSDNLSAPKYFELSNNDPATSWIELHPSPNLTAVTTGAVFDNNWLCCYHRPYKSIYDLRGVPLL
jgi:hypothetical protein